MELEQSRPVNPAMTFDEVSMERSKSFVKALQVRFSTLPLTCLCVRGRDFGSGSDKCFVFD